MNLGERYYELSLLGRAAFLEGTPQAALVIPKPKRSARGTSGPNSDTDVSDSIELALGSGSWSQGESPGPTFAWDLIPLSTLAGSSFVDLITLGRTSQNDIIISDTSVSRSQAFFRKRDPNWFLCDAGSKNGTRVDGQLLLPRTEIQLRDNARLEFGSVESRFCSANTLFDLFSGSTIL